MNIDMEWLVKNDACEESRQEWKADNDNEHLPMLKRLISHKYYLWANWLIVRVMTRRQYLLYSAFATECAAPAYEKIHPNDDVIRRCISAVRAVAENDTKENRSAAESARSAAEYAARSAAEAAEAAAEYAAGSAESAEYAARSAAEAAEYAEYAESAEYAAEYAAGSAEFIKILEYGISLLEE
jgi:hypothetical protein